MDHNSFESNMIDFVNRNAQAEENSRDEVRRKQWETTAQLKRKKAIKAVVECILWGVAFVGIVTAMAMASYTNFVSAWVTTPASSVFALIAGVRINTLVILIARCGGR
jgi:hypothetical protein